MVAGTIPQITSLGGRRKKAPAFACSPLTSCKRQRCHNTKTETYSPYGVVAPIVFM
nr:MAG TPA: hypothetical protein [Caudoviricetes sp.]